MRVVFLFLLIIIPGSVFSTARPGCLSCISFGAWIKGSYQGAFISKGDRGCHDIPVEAATQQAC
jgi:hypothetical protein